ncbi:MAG: TonB-dependent receptor [Acidobacteriota bacterium]|nr:TonB-dependent receptor [Acidobacteriota bacterium]
MTQTLSPRIQAFVAIVLLSSTYIRLAPVAAQEAIILSGTVTDTSAAALPGATVQAIRGNRVTADTRTLPSGTYRLRLPAAGAYRIVAQLEGFTASAVSLEVSGNATQSFRLEIAPLNDTVVVTASSTPESRATVTESLSVFTADDIQTLGSPSLAEIVQQIPGLNIASAGREGSMVSLFSRGGESDYNHVLIDGVRTNVSGGQFDFSRISATEIERVEVVRGAQSALYGSDAIGSVVQIFTKRGSPTAPPRVFGSFEGGTFNSVRSDLRLLGGAQQRIDYQLGAAYRGSDGAFKNQLPDGDRFDQSSIDGSFGAILGDKIRVRAAGRYSNARGRAVGPIVYAPGDTGTLADSQNYSGHVTFDETVNPWFSHSAVATHFRNDQVSNDEIADPSYNIFAILAGEPGALFPDSPRLVRLVDHTTFHTFVVDPSRLDAGQFLASTPYGVSDWPFSFASEFRRKTFKYQTNLTWLDDQVLSAGYEYAQEEDPLLKRDATAPGFQIKDHAYFAQQQFVFASQWYATTGIRVDDNSRFGTQASPKVSIGGYPLAITDGAISSIKVFANLGKGIKTPTFSELFGSAWVDGNAALTPERAITMDAGAEITFDAQRWLWRATWFDNEYTDQVAFQYSAGWGGDGVPDFLNIAGSQARGVELEGGLQRPIGGMTAMTSYAYVDTAVVATTSTSEQFQPGQPLLRRPKHSGTLQVNYAYGRVSVHLNVRVTGDRHDAAFLGLSRQSDGLPVNITVNSGYTIVSLGGQYRLNNELTLFLRADNLTDELYESVLGYPGLPRTFVVGGRFNLGK